MIAQIKEPPSQTIVNIKDCILKFDLFGTEIGSDLGMCRTEVPKLKRPVNIILRKVL